MTCSSSPYVASITCCLCPSLSTTHTFSLTSHFFSTPCVCLFDTLFIPSCGIHNTTLHYCVQTLTLIPYFRILLFPLRNSHHTTPHCDTSHQFSRIIVPRWHKLLFMKMIVSAAANNMLLDVLLFPLRNSHHTTPHCDTSHQFSRIIVPRWHKLLFMKMIVSAAAYIVRTDFSPTDTCFLN